MSQGLFFVTAVNPNDVTGGGGCICSPEKQATCAPPYIVAPGNDMENIASPSVVVSCSCVERMTELLAGEVGGAGETGDVQLALIHEDDEDVPEV